MEASAATGAVGGHENGPSDAAVGVRGLTKIFGGLRAVDGVSFEVRRGSISAVIGPNGAGKTTLFNMATGVIRPTSGSVFVNGRDVTGWPSHRMTQVGMARTFQNIRLFPNLTILENVLVGRIATSRTLFVETLLAAPRHRRERRANGQAADELLHEFGLFTRRYAYPRELPYGDQRRCEIARALATNPQILMLDEPCAGMSHGEAFDLITVLRRLNAAGQTIVLIEHNMRLVMELAQRIFVLNFGTQIASGTPAEIQGNQQVLEAYLGATG